MQDQFLQGLSSSLRQNAAEVVQRAQTDVGWKNVDQGDLLLLNTYLLAELANGAQNHPEAQPNPLPWSQKQLISGIVGALTAVGVVSGVVATAVMQIVLPLLGWN